MICFQTHGIPPYFGIFYAVGIGLVIQGFMSSFYHICPDGSNFGFGKTFKGTFLHVSYHLKQQSMKCARQHPKLAFHVALILNLVAKMLARNYR